jgi:hypothetical protein
MPAFHRLHLSTNDIPVTTKKSQKASETQFYKPRKFKE